MGVRRAPVTVTVRRIGDVALATITNRTGHVVWVEATGVEGGPRTVRLAGNDQLRTSWSVVGDLVVTEPATGTTLHPTPTA